MSINDLLGIPRKPTPGEKVEPRSYMFGNFEHAMERASAAIGTETSEKKKSFSVRFHRFGNGKYDIGADVKTTDLPSVAFDCRYQGDSDGNTVWTANHKRWNPIVMSIVESTNNRLAHQVEIQMGKQKDVPKQSHFDVFLELNDADGKPYRSYTLRSCTVVKTELVSMGPVSVDFPITDLRMNICLQFYDVDVKYYDTPSSKWLVTIEDPV